MRAAGAPYHGRCFCGAIRYRVTQEPLTLYACHCTECQQRTGSAFALSMWVRREDLELLEGEPSRYTIAGESGKTKVACYCAKCTARLWGEPIKAPDLAIVQPGTLDQPIGLEPVAHIWTRSAQPWYDFRPDAIKFELQPEDMTELMRIWQRSRPAKP
jgi:hypothetical protein